MSSLFSFAVEDTGAVETLANPVGLVELCELSAGKFIIDVGANIGWYTVQFAQRAGRVFALEPTPRAFELLKKNTEGLPNVEITNCGLGAQESVQQMFFNHRHWGSASLRSSTGGDTVAVHIKTLDSFGLAPHIIKIDVEGGELDVVRGASETLRKHQPVVFCETAPWCANFGYCVTDLIQFMDGLGYGWRNHGQGNAWFTPK